MSASGEDVTVATEADVDTDGQEEEDMWTRIHPESPVLLATLLVAAATVAAVPTAVHAQSAYRITFPEATQRALDGREGASWDDIRRGGLVVKTRALKTQIGWRFSGRSELVVHALALNGGRVVRQWSSRRGLDSRSIRQGDLNAEDTFLPGDRFLPGAEFLAGVAPLKPAEFLFRDYVVTVDDALAAAGSGRTSAFVDSRQSKSATGVLLVVVPACAGTGECSQDLTSPYFLQTEDWSE